MIRTGSGSGRRVALAALGTLSAATIVALVPLSSGPAAARTPRITGPSAVTDLAVTPTNEGGDVSWSPPLSDGGSPVTGYTVKVGTQFCSTDNTFCDITGLKNGKSYFVIVWASNAVKPGKHARVTLVAGQSPDCANFTPGANLQYCKLKDANLAGDDLAGANFYGASLYAADLEGADLDDAVLTDADINYVTLTGAQLDGTVFDTEDPSLSDDIVSGGVTGTPADLPPAFSVTDGYLVGPVANLSGADLASAALTGQSFLDADLVDADLDSAVLTDANFTGANLDAASTTGATFTGATWSGTTCPDGTDSNNDGGTCANNLG